MTLSTRQAAILSTVLKAGNAAQFTMTDARGMRPVYALNKSHGLHYMWTGNVVSCWIGDRCPFVQAVDGGYTHEDNVQESATILPERRHLRAMVRTGVTPCPFTGKAFQ